MSAKVVNGAVCWRSGMAVDADGCPRAYKPGGGGLDAIGNAGHPGNWFGIVCGRNGEPIVQGDHDPCPGFYVSPTAYGDHTKAETDPRRYVDSEHVPYVSIPPELLASKGGQLHMGDVAIVVYKGAHCAAVIAEVGPHGKYGEGSMALAVALGIPSSPRNGGCESGVVFVAFPGTSAPWPRDMAQVKQKAEELFAAWGGLAGLAGV